MAISALAGSRVRERRQSLGMRQAELARAAGISGSYLNLIEHNRRRVGGEVLDRLARALGVEPRAIAEGAGAARVDDLRAAAADAPPDLPGGVRPEIDRAEEFLGRFPGWAELLAAQHGRARELERAVGALVDRLGQDPHLSAALHEVLSAAASVRSTAAILAEGEEIEPVWRARFHANLQADSERLSAGAEALVAYLDASEGAEAPAAAAPQEEMERWLSRRGWHLVELEPGGAGRAALEAEVAGLASGAARALARGLVAEGAADVAAMPAAMVAASGGDPLRLAALAGAGVVAAMRRIALAPGAAEGLVICDAAGALTLRKPLEGFVIPRAGSACALWPLFAALTRPGAPIQARGEMPGPVPRRYDLRACAEARHPEGFGGPELRLAGMLILPAPDEAPGALRLGSTCRVCPRDACPARREPSVMSEFALAAQQARRAIGF